MNHQDQKTAQPEQSKAQYCKQLAQAEVSLFVGYTVFHLTNPFLSQLKHNKGRTIAIIKCTPFE